MFAGPEVPDVADQHLMEIDGWAEALARQCAGLRDELMLLAPWLATPKSETGGVALVAEGSGAITLRTLAAMHEASDAALPESASLLAQGAARARERIAAIDDLISRPVRWRRSTTASCSTRCAASS